MVILEQSVDVVFVGVKVFEGRKEEPCHYYDYDATTTAGGGKARAGNGTLQVPSWRCICNPLQHTVCADPWMIGSPATFRHGRRMRNTPEHW
jgi:hypothetical protein